MANKKNFTIGGIVLVVLAAYLGLDLPPNSTNTDNESVIHQTKTQEQNSASSRTDSTETNKQTAQDDTVKIAQAFQSQKSDLQVTASGKVVAILKDDNEGSRHQKIILELANGQTVLLAHNIDLAPRIDDLRKGDMVQFYGEYEYSAKGGVIHWTHADPAKRHPDGWLKHAGRTYQ